MGIKLSSDLRYVEWSKVEDQALASAADYLAEAQNLILDKFGVAIEKQDVAVVAQVALVIATEVQTTVKVVCTDELIKVLRSSGD